MMVSVTRNDNILQKICQLNKMIDGHCDIEAKNNSERIDFLKGIYKDVIVEYIVHIRNDETILQDECNTSTIRSNKPKKETVCPALKLAESKRY